MKAFCDRSRSEVWAELESRSMPEPMSGCWLWVGRIGNQGYGRLDWIGFPPLAHRAVFEFIQGAIPLALVLDHTCRTRSCVNPGHLRPVTNTENVLAPGALGFGRVNLEKLVCPRGHPLAAPNLVVSDLNRGSRKCLACSRAFAAMKRVGSTDIQTFSDIEYRRIA